MNYYSFMRYIINHMVLENDAVAAQDSVKTSDCHRSIV